MCLDRPLMSRENPLEGVTACPTKAATTVNTPTADARQCRAVSPGGREVRGIYNSTYGALHHSRWGRDSERRAPRAQRVCDVRAKRLAHPSVVRVNASSKEKKRTAYVLVQVDLAESHVAETAPFRAPPLDLDKI